MSFQTDIKFVFAAVKKPYAQNTNFTKNLSQSQNLKSFDFL